MLAFLGENKSPMKTPGMRQDRRPLSSKGYYKLAGNTRKRSFLLQENPMEGLVTLKDDSASKIRC